MSVCPLPPPGTRFASGPDTRGTLDILYTCLSVIILSTWNVLHLNVPIRSYPRNWKERFRRNVITAYTKARWMFLNVVAPELMIARSLDQRLIAQGMSRHIKEYVHTDQVDWSLAHSFFAGMRGFEITFAKAMTTSEEFNHRRDVYYGEPVCAQVPLRRNVRRSVALIGAGLAQFGIDSMWPQNLEPGLEGPRGAASYELVEFVCQKQEMCCPRSDEESQSGHDTSKRTFLQHDISPSVMIQPQPNTSDFTRPVPGVALCSINLCRLALANTQLSISSHWLGPIAWKPNVDNWRAMVNAWQLVYAREWTAREKDKLVRNLAALQGSSWRPNAEQLLLARKMEIIKKLPHLPVDELDDRCQSDGVLKFVSACQIFWLVLQVSARGIAKLPTTLLEILALASAACALIIYVLLWSKPQDVRTTVRVKAVRSPTPDEMIRIALAGGMLPSEGGIMALPLHAMFADNGFVGMRSENLAPWSAFGIAGGGILFGAFHLIPWNFSFPTELERTLWRISALLITFLPLLLLGTLRSTSIIRSRYQNPTLVDYHFLYHGAKRVEIILGLVYMLARMFSLAESFRSLAYLPPAAYRTSWLNFLPHFG